jgi:hypothetical protein
MDKNKSFNFLILLVIILNVITLFFSETEDKLLSVSSFKFDPFNLLEDLIILIDTIMIILSIYLLYIYKISNIFILALLLYYVCEKFMEEFIFLSNEKIKKTYQPTFFYVNNWLKKIFFVVQLYVLYCIFFTNNNSK